jgi:hypothetical protein
MVCWGAIAILAKRHIQYPVHSVLDPPMTTHCCHDTFHFRWQTADVTYARVPPSDKGKVKDRMFHDLEFGA